MKSLRIMFFSIMLLFNSCIDTNVQSPTAPDDGRVDIKGSLSKEPILSIEYNAGKPLNLPFGFTQSKDSVNTDAMLCGYKYVNGYVISKFIPKAGKYVGAWMYNSSATTWSNLKNKYGISQICVWDNTSHNIAMSVGYTFDNIIGLVPNYQGATSFIQNINVKYYYIDEPLEKGWSSAQLGQIALYIKINRPNSLMAMGSYKWPTQPYILPISTYGSEYKKTLNQNVNTRIVCDNYDGNIFGTVRDHWSKYKEYYGLSKSSFNWIKTTIADQSLLFGHASNLGQNQMWVYGLDITNQNNLYTLCRTAWSASWLRAIAQSITIVYRCSYQNPCDCSYTELEGWYIERIIYHNSYWEL